MEASPNQQITTFQRIKIIQEALKKEFSQKGISKQYYINKIHFLSSDSSKGRIHNKI